MNFELFKSGFQNFQILANHCASLKLKFIETSESLLNSLKLTNHCDLNFQIFGKIFRILKFIETSKSLIKLLKVLQQH
jgi:hypothetical protein